MIIVGLILPVVTTVALIEVLTPFKISFIESTKITSKTLIIKVVPIIKPISSIASRLLIRTRTKLEARVVIPVFQWRHILLAAVLKISSTRSAINRPMAPRRRLKSLLVSRITTRHGGNPKVDSAR
jgi:hypothetical protein